MRRTLPFLAALLLACGPDNVTADGGSAGSTSIEPTTSDSSSTSPSTGSSGHADESTDDPGVAFIGPVDLGPGEECDVFVQNCPPGFKCNPYSANGSGVWDAAGCFPVVEDPAAPGEPCTVEGGASSGIDTCELGSMCWDVDPKTNEGECIRMCTGDVHSRTCDAPDEYCHFLNDTPVYVCIPICHPLLDECDEGLGCYPHEYFGVPHSECIPDASGPDMGAPGDPCELVNECDPGAFCAVAEAVPECMDAIGCCSSYCSVGDDAPCLPGQVCQPQSEPEDTLPIYEGLGTCVLP
ncbi:MAG: ribulose phosphate epimerase [Myxococcales bacterium]|nr:ribulose phosphate epimerase [Myxococcales bacterium]